MLYKWAWIKLLCSIYHKTQQNHFKRKTHVPTKIYIRMFIAALFVIVKTINNSNALQQRDGETSWCKGLLLSNKEGQITGIHNNLDESQKHYAS